MRILHRINELADHMADLNNKETLGLEIIDRLTAEVNEMTATLNEMENDIVKLKTLKEQLAKILLQYPQDQAVKNQYHSCFKELNDCTTSKEQSEKKISSHQSTIDEIGATHKNLDEQHTQSSIEMYQLKIKVHKYDQTFPYIREEEDDKTEHDETKSLDVPQQRQTTPLPTQSKKQQPRVTPHRRGVKRKFTKYDEEQGLDFLQRVSKDEMHKHACKYNMRVRHQQQQPTGTEEHTMMPEGDSTHSAAGTPRKKYSRGEYMKPHSKPFDPNELSNTVIYLYKKYTDVTQDIAKTSQEYDQAVKICTPKKMKPAKSKDVISLQNRSITEKRINKASNPTKRVNIRYESEEALQILLQEDDTDDDDDNDDNDDDENNNPPPDNPGRKGGNGNNGNNGGQSGSFRSNPNQGIGSRNVTSKPKNGGNGGGDNNLGTRCSDLGTTSQVTEAHQKHSVRFLVESLNDVLTLHSIDDISNITPETQYTPKDVQLDKEDIVTEEITLHTHHLHEVAFGESSQKMDYSREMEIPQESEHLDEQECHIGAQFEVEENRSKSVDKLLESEHPDEQQFHIGA